MGFIVEFVSSLTILAKSSNLYVLCTKFAFFDWDYMYYNNRNRKGPKEISTKKYILDSSVGKCLATNIKNRVLGYAIHSKIE